jgi:SAM-dependent methyltransferase
MMKAVDRYSQRAISYARYRWDYAPAAVEAAVTECGLTEHSIIADIGSGTGMLTRHFVDRVRTVFAVEPNSDMRGIAAQTLHGCKAWQSIDGFSDATTLPGSSVDMITVGRALHWFPPDSTRTEFGRILRPDGWLAVFSAPCTDQALVGSLKAIRTEDNGWNVAADKHQLSRVPLSFYFGHDEFQKLTFAGLVKESWEDFLGRISSTSPCPRSDHPLRSKFELALREVFERHAPDGVLVVTFATEVVFGRFHNSR